MKFLYSVLLISTLLTTTHCSKSYHEPEGTAPELRIAPNIQTRATDMNFENQDAIGVTVRKQSGTNHLNNQKFVYDGNLFSASDVYWYPESEEASTVVAYYPYAETGQPGSFTVKTDQRGTGYALSDLLGAVKSEVKPTIESVSLTFHHLLSKIDIQTTVSEGITIEKIEIGGFIPTVGANIESNDVTVDANASATRITAHEITANKSYDVILPPQTVSQMQISVKTNTETREQTFRNVTLLKGKQYTLQLSVSQSEKTIDAKFTGQIENWGSGGRIEQNPDGDGTVVTPPANPNEGGEGSGVSYGGVTYKTRIIAGKEWMAENLRYIPEGAVPNTDYKYPDNNASNVETRGILYTYQTATAGVEPALNDAETVRGICPEGWRLPKIGELVELAKITGKSFFPVAGYFNNANSNGYNDQRSYVISSTVPEKGTAEYLRIKHTVEDQAIETCAIATGNISASIRCVKEKEIAQ